VGGGHEPINKKRKGFYNTGFGANRALELPTHPGVCCGKKIQPSLGGGLSPRGKCPPCLPKKPLGGKPKGGAKEGMAVDPCPLPPLKTPPKEKTQKKNKENEHPNKKGPHTKKVAPPPPHPQRGVLNIKTNRHPTKLKDLPKLVMGFQWGGESGGGGGPTVPFYFFVVFSVYFGGGSESGMG